jgi:hypothetical protein
LLTDLQSASNDSFFPQIDAGFIPGHEPGNAGASAVSNTRGMLAATLPSDELLGSTPDAITIPRICSALRSS